MNAKSYFGIPLYSYSKKKQVLEKNKQDTKLLFVNPSLRPGHFSKIVPVGLASVMTYFHQNGYEPTLLDIECELSFNTIVNCVR